MSLGVQPVLKALAFRVVVALIATGMHGDSMGTGCQAHVGDLEEIGLVVPARVANEGVLIDVHRQQGWAHGSSGEAHLTGWGA